MTLFRILIVFLLLLPGRHLLFSQRQDYTWVLGYEPNNQAKMLGGAQLDFNSSPITLVYFEMFSGTGLFGNSVFSNKSGELIAYSNGCKILNSGHKPALGGDSINFGPNYDLFCGSGANYPSNVMLLQSPKSDSLIALLQWDLPFDIDSSELLYAITQITPSGNLRVVLKDSILLRTTHSNSIAATKHANGQDWWVIVPKGESNDYFVLLIQPDKIDIILQENIGEVWNHRYWTAQSVFAPDGSTFVRASAFNGLNIFDFDRCTGILSNPRVVFSHLDSTDDVSGAAFSPNSRFLYVSTGWKVFQFDLLEDPLNENFRPVGEYDGFMSPFATNFWQMRLAPDGKIYCSSTSTNTVLHVINEPDLEGANCQFVNHGFKLPVHNTYSLPNVPYYRLGPMDGSSCDTLGIDNIPVSRFRYSYVDSFLLNDIRFTDLSYYRPEQWHWDFDDGSTSNEQHPLHTYESTGQYHVCLTVSNENASDSSCQTINVVVSSTEHQESPDRVRIFPNPVEDYLEIQLPRQEVFTLQLSTIDGRTLLAPEMTCPCRINLSSFDPGVYILTLLQDGQVVRTEKVVKL